MAKKFEFDDEKENEVVEDNPSDESFYNEELSKTQQSDIIEDTNEYIEDVDDGDDSLMVKKKKKFVWKWWHYALIGLGVIFVAFTIYIIVVSSNEGPVYGKTRCAGLETEINKDLRVAAADTIKKKYSEVESISMDIECKQLKVDIVFKEKMDTKKAKSITEEAVKTLDGLVGKSKENGKTYSTLFGYINNTPQYEVNLFLQSNDSDDFPIYGTKHTQNDEFSYTLASVRDEDSKDAAQDTLKDKK